MPTGSNKDGIFFWSNFQKEYGMGQGTEDDMRDVILLDN